MLTLAIGHDSQFLLFQQVLTVLILRLDSISYLLPHSKTMLTLAISHDSQFLLFQQVLTVHSISYLILRLC